MSEIFIKGAVGVSVIFIKGAVGCQKYLLRGQLECQKYLLRGQLGRYRGDVEKMSHSITYISELLCRRRYLLV